jgi:hypothetical protein
MPKAARERVASPPAGTALAPQFGNASRTASEQWARFGLYVSETGTNVNGSVTLIFPSPLAGEGVSRALASEAGKGATRGAC